jgi:hypothetical protein
VPLLQLYLGLACIHKAKTVWASVQGLKRAASSAAQLQTPGQATARLHSALQSLRAGLHDGGTSAQQQGAGLAEVVQPALQWQGVPAALDAQLWPAHLSRPADGSGQIDALLDALGGPGSGSWLDAVLAAEGAGEQALAVPAGEAPAAEPSVLDPSASAEQTPSEHAQQREAGEQQRKRRASQSMQSASSAGSAPAQAPTPRRQPRRRREPAAATPPSSSLSVSTAEQALHRPDLAPVRTGRPG